MKNSFEDKNVIIRRTAHWIRILCRSRMMTCSVSKKIFDDAWEIMGRHGVVSGGQVSVFIYSKNKEDINKIYEIIKPIVSDERSFTDTVGI